MYDPETNPLSYSIIIITGGPPQPPCCRALGKCSRKPSNATPAPIRRKFDPLRDVSCYKKDEFCG